MATLTPEQARDWFRPIRRCPSSSTWPRLEPDRVLISSHADEVIRLERGYGENGQKPDDYLESFRHSSTRTRMP